ncbi:MAG TPA: hypothetical protein VFA07_14775 [Chthonomonadaceae bacterium]|nr:hypothetical protein [Chthonomonadaceae bacterium]
MSWQGREEPCALMREAPAPLSAHYSLLGIPLEVHANASEGMALADEVFGIWGLPTYGTEKHSLRLHIYLEEDVEAAAVSVEERRLRADDRHLFLSVGQSRGYADRQEGIAVAVLTPALLAERVLAQCWFLECLAMYLACRYRRATLHAACVAYQGRGVLLTGRDGVGKSTLAYACVRAGFQLVAEDIVFAEPDQPVCVWGNPWHIHLLPEAISLFPELARAERTVLLNGETKLRLQVQDLRADAAVTHIPVWGVLSLSRSGGFQSVLSPADPASLRVALTGFKGNVPLDLTAMEAAAGRLAAGHTAHLNIGTDLQGAIDTILGWLCVE